MYIRVGRMDDKSGVTARYNHIIGGSGPGPMGVATANRLQVQKCGPKTISREPWQNPLSISEGHLFGLLSPTRPRVVRS